MRTESVRKCQFSLNHSCKHKHIFATECALVPLAVFLVGGRGALNLEISRFKFTAVHMTDSTVHFITLASGGATLAQTTLHLYSNRIPTRTDCARATIANCRINQAMLHAGNGSCSELLLSIDQ
eukprot:SAG31_NODE_353_length_17229_cov_8.702160_7_plen_124_part_00